MRFAATPTQPEICPAFAVPQRFLCAVVDSRVEVRRLANRLERLPCGAAWVAHHLALGRADEAARTAAVKKEFMRLDHATQLPFLALVVACLHSAADAPLSVQSRLHALEGLRMLHPHEGRALAQLMFDDLALARRLCANYAVQTRLELCQQGDSYSTFHSFTRSFVPLPSQLCNGEKTKELVAQYRNNFVSPPDVDGLAVSAHGRTLHFCGADGENYALKLQKTRHDALAQEDLMIQFFCKWKDSLKLQSDLPTNSALTYFQVPPHLQRQVRVQAQYENTSTFEVALDEDARTPALYFRAPKNYHLHLHEAPKLAALRNAATSACHDAGRLAGDMGLLNVAPADMYHNAEKGRRYFWNVDVLRRAVGARLGAGRLEAWEPAIRNINEGTGGLRDLKHFRPAIDRLSAYRGVDRSAPRFRHQVLIDTIASLSGDLLLAHSLSLGKWFLDRGRLHDIEALGDTLQCSFVAFFAAFSRRPSARCQELLATIIDWPRMARQMHYFLGHTYIADVARGKLPAELFDTGCTLKVEVPSEGWHPLRGGWMLDGKHRDLGPKNGPNPLTELIRALYLTTALAPVLRPSAATGVAEAAAIP